MSEGASHAVRVELLAIIGAVGSIREHAVDFEGSDYRYIEDEVAKIQSAAHRLLEFLDNVEGGLN